jgi:predicted nucleic acid-binding protein
MNSDLRVLLDTGFCLQLMRTAAGDVARALSGFQPGEIAVSALTEAELRARAQRSADPRRNLTALEQFLLPLQIVDFDQVAATRLATVNVLAAAQGIVPGFREIIAAQAIALNLPLITAMPAAYRHVAGLTVRGRLAESAPGTLGGLRAAESPQEITLAGSHDLIFDLLTTWLAAGTPARKMTLLPLGSLGGLLALQRGEAHIAGAHLLDTETGEYNSSYRGSLWRPGIRFIWPAWPIWPAPACALSIVSAGRAPGSCLIFICTDKASHPPPSTATLARWPRTWN